MLLTWSTTGQIIWGLTLEMAGRIALEATKVTKSWKQIKIKDKLEGKIFTKFRKSCRPVVFGQEGVFTIKRMTVLKFFRAIVKGTFRALLTIGEWLKSIAIYMQTCMILSRDDECMYISIYGDINIWDFVFAVHIYIHT